MTLYVNIYIYINIYFPLDKTLHTDVYESIYFCTYIKVEKNFNQ